MYSDIKPKKKIAMPILKTKTESTITATGNSIDEKKIIPSKRKNPLCLNS